MEGSDVVEAGVEGAEPNQLMRVRCHMKSAARFRRPRWQIFLLALTLNVQRSLESLMNIMETSGGANKYYQVSPPRNCICSVFGQRPEGCRRTAPGWGVN